MTCHSEAQFGRTRRGPQFTEIMSYHSTKTIRVTFRDVRRFLFLECNAVLGRGGVFCYQHRD